MNNKFRFVAQTTSTNQQLEALMQGESLPHGFCLYTDFQTQGKGQGDHSWASTRGENLLFSLLLKELPVKPAQQFIISQVVSLSICEALQPLCPDVQIKWPNDIYVGSRKLAGILIKHVLQGDTVRYSIIGIGMNVNQTVFDSLLPNPVSLRQLTGVHHDRQMLLQTITATILNSCSTLAAEHYQAIEEAYSARLYHL
ncbi:MAG: biotin--[acetyl-CoA-carboxylase] ligase [Prevotellaceae bacterium]|jgi:BirA family biotin operon repressor/biotin-[acetyl-CoA-carboxylase] ligase|nr:biotin--[acetyl-CoA-carboxylase] ligase [Prevotellaceae bacterium]